MNHYQPSNAFVLASWAALFTGVGGFLIGIWQSGIGLEEKGYYFAVLVLGLFAATSIQKSVRDRSENIPVTDTYLGVCWLSTVIAVLLLVVGLYNATGLDMSEKGFFGMAYTLGMFAVITVQKNVRDLMLAKDLKASPTAFPPQKLGGEMSQ